MSDDYVPSDSAWQPKGQNLSTLPMEVLIHNLERIVSGEIIVASVSALEIISEATSRLRELVYMRVESDKGSPDVGSAGRDRPWVKDHAVLTERELRKIDCAFAGMIGFVQGTGNQPSTNVDKASEIVWTHLQQFGG